MATSYNAKYKQYQRIAREILRKAPAFFYIMGPMGTPEMHRTLRPTPKRMSVKRRKKLKARGQYDCKRKRTTR